LPWWRKSGREEVEKMLSALMEKYESLEMRVDRAVEKVEKVERGTRLLTEAMNKIITYLKDLEWSKEEKPARAETAQQPMVKQNTIRYLNETEKKILEEVGKRGIITANECYVHVGKTEEHVSRLLKRLAENGLLVRERRGKTFYYRLAEK
jgi:uncharacterized membrane protein